MKRQIEQLIRGLEHGLKHFRAESEYLRAELTGRCGRAAPRLSESDWLTLKLFVSLQIVLFYGVGVISYAVETLPHSPVLYILGCGSTGLVAAVMLKRLWQRKAS